MPLLNLMKKIFFSLLIVGSLLAPSFAEAALTQGQINAILGLLRSFGAETQIVSQVQATLEGRTPVTPTPVPPAFCYTFTRNLGVGAQNADVTNLVSVLVKEGILNRDEWFQDGRHVLNFDERLAARAGGFQRKKKIRPRSRYLGTVTPAQI